MNVVRRLGLALLTMALALAVFAMHGSASGGTHSDHSPVAIAHDTAGAHDHPSTGQLVEAVAPCDHDANSGDQALACVPALVGAVDNRGLLVLVAMAALAWCAWARRPDLLKAPPPVAHRRSHPHPSTPPLLRICVCRV